MQHRDQEKASQAFRLFCKHRLRILYYYEFIISSSPKSLELRDAWNENDVDIYCGGVPEDY